LESLAVIDAIRVSTWSALRAFFVPWNVRPTIREIIFPTAFVTDGLEDVTADLVCGVHCWGLTQDPVDLIEPLWVLHEVRCYLWGTVATGRDNFLDAG
jgi:hypothetical protein